jgi:putative ABC transport system permease protein
LTVRLESSNHAETKKFIKKTWEDLFPDKPFVSHQFDELFSQNYIEEDKFGGLILLFTILTTFIACLGLLGLSLFTAKQMTKEISVRKVFGASKSIIFIIFMKRILILIFIANLIAWPLAWISANNWLGSFAYHIDLPIYNFLIAASISLIVTLLINSWYVIKYCLVNPVDMLRYE